MAGRAAGRAASASGRRVLLVAVGLLVGTGQAVHGSSLPPTTSGDAASVGDARVLDPGVEHRSGATGSYAAIRSSIPVAAGDGVRTDATGFAEIAYPDGSRTRLDVDTEFEVVDLAAGPGAAETRTAMDLGRTWHRVESLGAADGGFSVETSQATATVTGTAFTIDCPSPSGCSYAVVEGSLSLTLADGTELSLTAPSAVDVVNGVAGAVRALSFDEVFGDPWLADNAARDAAAGFPDAAAIAETHGLAFASMAGPFEVTGTVTAVECATFCLDGTLVVGDSIDYSYTFDDVEFDGSSFTLTARSDQPCGFDDDGDGVIDRETGRLTGSDVHVITPAAVELRDGVPSVVAFTGTLTTSYAMAAGECYGGGYLGQSATATITGRR